MRDAAIASVEAYTIAAVGKLVDRMDESSTRILHAPRAESRASAATGACSRLRVLTCLHSFEPGGVERVALRLCTAWSAAGFEAGVLVGRSDGDLRSEAPHLAYDVAPRPGVSTAAIETLWMIWWLWRRVRLDPPDLLFGAGNTYAIVMVAMKLLLGQRCPPVVLKISNDVERADHGTIAKAFYRRWCRLQGRLMDHFVVLADPMRCQIEAAMAVGPERISIVPDPALSVGDLKMFAAAGDRSRASRGTGRRFIAVGRLVRQKNFRLLLDAFASGGCPEDSLIIVGSGPERPALEARIRDLELGDRVTLAGHRNDLAGWFAKSDIFVLSSDYEGLPAVVVEALAAGLPVIATDCSASMKFLLDDGQLGRLVPVGSQNALAWAIAATEPESTPRVRARLKASQFTITRAAAAYEALFRDLARW